MGAPAAKDPSIIICVLFSFTFITTFLTSSAFSEIDRVVLLKMPSLKRRQCFGETTTSRFFRFYLFFSFQRNELTFLSYN